MTIKFFDLQKQTSLLNYSAISAIEEVIKSTNFSGGEFVEKFENEFSEYIGVKHCIAVNSGTSALHLALLSKNIGTSSEVITTPHSFIATSWAITYSGAKPVFVDVDPNTGLIDLKKITAVISSKTKLFLPVHLYGNPINLSVINQISKEFNIPIVEDAAQAHASKFQNKMIGSWGNTTCFSFYPGKNLGAFGEGGCILTNDEEEAEFLRRLRNHGQSVKYKHEHIGFNYRMDGIQAAILSVKLKQLNSWTKRRHEIASYYRQELGSLSSIKLLDTTENASSSNHLFVIHVEDRANLAEFLTSKSIQSSYHYPTPIHLQKAYSFLGHKRGDFPVTEKLADTCISLPLYPEMDNAHCEKVVEALREWSVKN